MVGMSSVYGADTTQQTTKSMKGIVKDQINNLNTNQQIQVPKFLGTDYGALASNTIWVRVNKFSVAYNKKPPADIQKILNSNITSQANKEMQIKDIIALLAKTEKQIVQAGYPFIKVILPIQDIPSGGADVKVQLVSGFVENIDVDITNKNEISQKSATNIVTLVKNIVGKLRTDSYLKSKDLNRVLLTLRDHYGLSSQLFISPGDELGGFNVNISTAFNRNTGVLTVKNNLGPAFKHYGSTFIGINNRVYKKSTAQLSLAAMLSLSQQSTAYYRMLHTTYTHRFLSGRELGATIAVSRTASIASNNFQLDGASDSIGFSFKVPLVLTFETVANVTLGYDYGKSSSYNVNSEEFQSLDKTSVVNVAFDVYRERAGRSHALNIKLNKNVAFKAKATTVNGIESSRQGATTQAGFVNVDYEFSTKLANRFRYILTLNGQYSPGKSLLNGQKFSLMGNGQVRGFVGDSTTGDSGAVLNNAVVFKPIMIRRKWPMSPSLDIAVGTARLYTHTSAESKTPRAASATVSFTTTTTAGNQIELGAGYAIKRGLKRKQDRFINFGVTVPIR